MDKENPQKKKQRLFDSNYAKYSGLALQMGITIGLGVWGGIKLDEYFGLKKFPAFTIFLPVLAIAASLYFVLKDLLKK